MILNITQSDYYAALHYITSEIDKQLTKDVNIIVTNVCLMSVLLDSLQSTVAPTKYSPPVDKNSKLPNYLCVEYTCRNDIKTTTINMFVDPNMSCKDKIIYLMNDDKVIAEIELLDDKNILI